MVFISTCGLYEACSGTDGEMSAGGSIRTDRAEVHLGGMLVGILSTIAVTGTSVCMQSSYSGSDARSRPANIADQARRAVAADLGRKRSVNQEAAYPSGLGADMGAAAYGCMHALLSSWPGPSPRTYVCWLVTAEHEHEHARCHAPRQSSALWSIQVGFRSLWSMPLQKTPHGVPTPPAHTIT